MLVIPCHLYTTVAMQMHREMTNLEIAKLLKGVAAAYQVKEKQSPNDRFRIIAYQRAADAIEHATSEARNLWEEGKLDEIPGIGKAIAEHLDELFRTGKVKHLEEVMKDLPEAMFELVGIPGIGPKTAYKLTKVLGITKAHGAVEKLKEAAEKGRIKEIEGFGEQSEKEILASLAEVAERTRRLPLPYASGIAEDVVAWLRKNPNVKRADPLGSLRRQVSTVGDIDIAVATNKPKEVIEHFTYYPKKTKILEKGIATASILLPGSVQVDLMVQPPPAYGALLQHFTGSKHHNIVLRTLAQKKGMSLSEYGIKKNNTLIKFATEEDFYKTLGMKWIPPEIRENNGEVEAALKDKLPDLITLEDIKGDFHMHTNIIMETSHDQGRSSPEDHIKEAERLGYEYIAFSEHNPKSALSEARALDLLKRRKEKINKLNEKYKKVHVFNSLEIDIGPDGKLALSEKAFDLIDFAIVSVHSSFRGPKDRQTKRVLKALEHPKAKIFGHPTGRKLNEREGADYDWEKIFDFCKKHNKWLEINSWPDRLDLPDSLVHEAVKRGIRLTIDTDSHAVSHMTGMKYGVSVARRGWAEKKDIVNTLGYTDIRKLISELS